MHAPPLEWTASTTSPRQESTAVTPFTAAGMTPVWPTMSELAKLMIPKRKPSSLQARAKASAAPRALISGFWS